MALAQRLNDLFFDRALPTHGAIRHFGSTSRPPVPARAPANDSQAGRPPRPANSPVILVVDDDPEHCAYMAEVLTRRGFRVAMTLSGREALRRLESGETFDAVVTDVYMPQIDGIELVRELRERWPALRVVAVTGGGIGQPTGVPNFLKFLGVSAILAKPFEPRDLAQAVENATRETSE